MTKIIDGVLWFLIVIMGYLTISCHASGSLGYGGVYWIEILIYLSLVTLLLVFRVNKTLTYLIASPLLLLAIILIPLFGIMGN